MCELMFQFGILIFVKGAIKHSSLWFFSLEIITKQNDQIRMLTNFHKYLLTSLKIPITKKTLLPKLLIVHDIISTLAFNIKTSKYGINKYVYRIIVICVPRRSTSSTFLHKCLV